MNESENEEVCPHCGVVHGMSIYSKESPTGRLNLTEFGMTYGLNSGPDNLSRALLKLLAMKLNPLNDSLPVMVHYHYSPGLEDLMFIGSESMPKQILAMDFADIELRAAVNRTKRGILYGVVEEGLRNMFEFGTQLGRTGDRFGAMSTTFKSLYGEMSNFTTSSFAEDPNKKWWENKSIRHAGDGHMSHIKREKARNKRRRYK